MNSGHIAGFRGNIAGIQGKYCRTLPDMRLGCFGAVGNGEMRRWGDGNFERLEMVRWERFGRWGARLRDWETVRKQELEIG